MASQAKGIDEDLGRRLVSLTRSEQRWLKTVLHAIESIELAEGEEAAPPSAAARPQARREGESRGETFSTALEELLGGDVTLEECLRKYPDLAEELRAVSEVADLLRQAGGGRRRLGEEILKGFDLGRVWPEEEEDEGDQASHD